MGNPNEVDYTPSILSRKARALTGNLLLIHGMMDPYYHLGGMYQLISALLEAGKSFHHIAVPQGEHANRFGEVGLRHVWDFLVRNLGEATLLILRGAFCQGQNG